MRAVLLCFLVACGAGDAGYAGGGDSSPPPTQGCIASNECPAGSVCNDFGACVPAGGTTPDGGVTEPPPEVEHEVGTPISSQRFVYVAMTEYDELARIDGANLAVTSTPVGEAPEVVAAIPNGDGAIVLDSTNATATIVRPATGAEGDAQQVLATLVNLNRVDIDPSGRYAVAWFDLVRHVQSSGISGVGSFQDVTVISLAPGDERAVDLTVGFHPRAVTFDAAGTRAYVITDDGVSVIDLGYAVTHGPSIVAPVAVAPVGATNVEVDVLPTGQLAAVRVGGELAVRIVDVAGPSPGSTTQIALPSPATDVDLAPDGSAIYALAREAKQLAIIPLPASPATVTRIDLTGHASGSLVLSADGTRALVYTNATLDPRLTKIELAQPNTPVVTWPLKKSVLGVGISPDASSAIVLAAKEPGDPATASTTEEYIRRSYGYALVDLTSGFAKLQITPVAPGAFAYAPDSEKAYVALSGGDAVTATRALQVITARTGVVTTLPLLSPPTAVGVLPGAQQAFVAQRHPLGRVTFVDFTTNQTRTVTGFDLNGNIVN